MKNIDILLHVTTHIMNHNISKIHHLRGIVTEIQSAHEHGFSFLLCINCYIVRTHLADAFVSHSTFLGHFDTTI